MPPGLSDFLIAFAIEVLFEVASLVPGVKQSFGDESNFHPPSGKSIRATGHLAKSKSGKSGKLTR
jgi:hypothetical protein